MYTKNIRDQIIKGTLDRNTVGQFLKQPDLELKKAITLCRTQEAAKKQCREMGDYNSGANLAVTQCRQQPTTQLHKYPVTCPPRCEFKPHAGG